jgi:hypothetical protein
MDQFEARNSENPPSSPPPGTTPARGSSGTVHTRPTADVDINERLIQLEVENSRLQQLVAELLIKNHQLRKAE